MDIVIEGIDGSGKSSLIKIIEDYFIKQNKEVKIMNWFRDPQQRKLADIYNISGIMTPEILSALHASSTLSLLYQQDLKPVDIRLWDRYIYSSYCSSVIRGMNPQIAEKIVSMFPTPKVTIVLLSNPEICFERIDKRGGVNFYESGLDRLYFGYHRLSGFNKFGKASINRNLVRDCFILTMNEWNEQIQYITPKNRLLIENFDLNNKNQIKQVMENIAQK